VPKGGETEAAILFRNDHPEKTMTLDKLPDVLGKIVQFMGDFPVVAQAA